MATGYVLINVHPGSEQQVFDDVKQLPHVTDATVLFGDHDLIVKLEADDLATIAKAVVENIHHALHQVIAHGHGLVLFDADLVELVV